MKPYEGIWEERQHCVEQIKEADDTINKINAEINLYHAKIVQLTRMKEDIEESIQGTVKYIESLANEIIVQSTHNK